MHQITTDIANHFQKAGLKFAQKEAGELSYLELGFGLKGVNLTIRVLSSGEDQIKIQSSDFANFKTDRLAVAYEVANQLNNRFKYVKFRIDPDDGAISCDHDVPSSVINAGQGPKAAEEIVYRMANIVETAYPDIMKRIWG